MRNFRERLKRVQFVYLIITVLISYFAFCVAYESMLDVRYTRQIEQKHYEELTKPHTQHQEVKNKLDILDRTLERAKEWIFFIEAQGKDVTNLLSVFTDAENLMTKAETEFHDNNLTDADNLIQEASQLAAEILLPPVSISFEPDSVSIVAYGFLGVGVEIDEGTVGKTREGVLLNTISFSVDGILAPSEHQDEIIYAYDIEPDGATFSKPITLTFVYDQSRIPEGYKEKYLKVAFWDRNAGKWNIVRGSTVDIKAHSISVSVSALYPLAVVAIPQPPTKPINWPLYVGIGIVLIFIFTMFVPLRKKANGSQRK